MIIRFYLTLFICIALPTSSYTMDLVSSDQYFASRDFVGSFTHQCSLRQTSAFLRTCTTYYNFYAQGLPLCLLPKSETITECELHNIQFGINRYIQEHPEKILLLENKSYVNGIIHYTQHNNLILSQIQFRSA